MIHGLGLRRPGRYHDGIRLSRGPSVNVMIDGPRNPTKSVIAVDAKIRARATRGWRCHGVPFGASISCNQPRQNPLPPDRSSEPLSS